MQMSFARTRILIVSLIGRLVMCHIKRNLAAVQPINLTPVFSEPPIKTEKIFAWYPHYCHTENKNVWFRWIMRLTYTQSYSPFTVVAGAGNPDDTVYFYETVDHYLLRML